MNEQTPYPTLANVQRLGHIAIRVQNIDRAKSFYMALGMKLIWDDKDWCYLETRQGKDGLALLGPGYKAAGPHFAFHFSNKAEIESIHKDLLSAGIKAGPLYGHRDGTSSFYVQDPEGNWFEILHQPHNVIKSNQ